MLNIKFVQPNDEINILALGAHCDDIEIGCGGTILKLIDTVKTVNIHWIVMSSDKRRKKESLSCAGSFLEKLTNKSIIIRNYKNGYFPSFNSEIKDYFEILKKKFTPDIIFTHFREDLHQDHRVISELTWNTFRNHLILEYEIPKYDGDIATPNFYVELNKATCLKKVNSIMKYYNTQRSKHWFTEDLFYSMLRIRGMESNSSSKYAEGFYCRKIVY